jgi:hypothetical protein
MVPIQCPDCGAYQRQSTVSALVGTAVCDTCGVFFRPSTAGPSAPTTPSPTKAVPVELPERFKVSRVGDRSLVVQWSSSSRWQVLQLVLAGVLLLLLAARVLVDPSPEPWTNRGGWLPVWLGLVAVLMAFGAVAQMVSYTRLICTRAALQVRRGPFPWYRSRVTLPHFDGPPGQAAAMTAAWCRAS